MENQEKFRTPNGNTAHFFFREGTNDRSIIESITTDDEYRIPDNYLGIGVDIGAHIGVWAITAAIDNPTMVVMALEAVFENYQLMMRNISLNGLDRRVSGLWKAASSSNHPVKVKYAFRGNPTAELHRFIGDQRGGTEGADYEVQTVLGLRLTRLARMLKDPIRILKIDCEGCEAHFLKSQAIGRVQEIIGEYHDGQQQIHDLLDATHAVEILRDEGGLGAFRAVRK